MKYKCPGCNRTATALEEWFATGRWEVARCACGQVNTLQMRGKDIVLGYVKVVGK